MRPSLFDAFRPQKSLGKSKAWLYKWVGRHLENGSAWNEARSRRPISTPTHTPSEIIAIVNKQVNAALADPRIKARFADVGATAFPMTSAEFGQLIAEDTEKWAKVIRAANIKAE